MTTAPKKSAPKAPPPPFAKKLITAWRNAAVKALKSRYANLSKLLPEPGVWEALAAAIDSGDVPHEALWRLGTDTLDHVPTRHAVALAKALPTDYMDLWSAYWFGQVALLTAMREAPAAFDDVYAESTGFARELLEIIRIQAGVAPPGSASEGLCRAIANWANGSAVPTVAQTIDGRVVRVVTSRATEPEQVSAFRSLGDQLLGHEKFVATLAEGHRARIERVESSSYERTMPIYPHELALLLASEAMTPEEVCSFQMTYAQLCVVAEKWSVDALIAAARATRDRARPNGYMVAGSAALLAVWRDPTCAPRVEQSIQLDEMNNTATPGVAATHQTLARTPASWRIRYVLDNLFDQDHQSPGTFSGPLGIVLLLPEEPEKAAALASKHANAIDYTRLNGIAPHALLALCEKAGPALRKRLALPIACGLIHCADKPESVDALISFDGSHRDSWFVGYAIAIPQDRALAILRREVEQGHGAFVRAAFTHHPAMLAALDAT